MSMTSTEFNNLVCKSINPFLMECFEVVDNSLKM